MGTQTFQTVHSCLPILLKTILNQPFYSVLCILLCLSTILFSVYSISVSVSTIILTAFSLLLFFLSSSHLVLLFIVV